MKFSRGFSLLAAAVIVGSAALKASAATVDLAFVNVNPGVSETYSTDSGAHWNTTTAGQFNFTVSANGVPLLITGSTVKTFCIDITQGLSTSPQTYSVLGPAYGAYVLPYANGGALNALFNQYYGTFASDATHDAAFQLAIWEIIQDGAPGSLTAGTFRVSGSNAAITQANTWLSGLNVNATGSWQIYQLHNANKQDQIFAVQSGGSGATAAPLPAALPGGLALMAGLAAYARFRRKSNKI